MNVAVDTIVNSDLDEREKEFLTRLARQVIRSVLEKEGKRFRQAEVSVLFTDDDFIAELNSQYRGEEGPTDVLSFPMMDPDSEVDATFVEGIPEMLGDIVISLDTAKRQAGEKDQALRKELELLLVHGMLHLLGYDHDEPEKEMVMWQKQEEILKTLGV